MTESSCGFGDGTIVVMIVPVSLGLGEPETEKEARSSSDSVNAGGNFLDRLFLEVATDERRTTSGDARDGELSSQSEPESLSSASFVS